MLIFLAVFAAAMAAVFAWDYRAELAKRPPGPEVIARNLTESFIGEKGSVKSLTYDRGTGRIEMVVAADLFKRDPKVSVKDQKELLSGAGEIAATRILQVIEEVRVVVVHLGYGDVRLATVTMERGKKEPTVTYSETLE